MSEKVAAGERGPDEIFLGNTRLADWPKAHFAPLKTIRLGNTALDIDGNRLDPARWKPVFLHNSEVAHHERIMVARMEAIANGTLKLHK